MKSRCERKGMTMAIGVIIAIVVLIVVALAVIAITSGSISKLFGATDPVVADSGSKIKGDQTCSTCGYIHTKGTASEMDDLLRTTPYFCEESSGSQFCCEDIVHNKCMAITDCGASKDSVIATKCTQATN